MVSVFKDSARTGYRVQIYVRGVRRSLWIGKVAIGVARSFAARLEQLKVAADTGTSPSAEALRWAKNIHPRYQKTLVKWGLIAAAKNEHVPRLVHEFADYYLDKKTGKPSTIKRWNNVIRHVKLLFPEETALASVTKGNTAEIESKLRSDFKPSHAGKLLSDLKQLFESAKDHEILVDNPFASVDLSDEHDKTREAYISRDTIEHVINHADPYYAALIVAARHAGLRIPSEAVTLTWGAISWSENRITIQSPKTGERIIPIFPELHAALQPLWDAAPEGQRYVFHRARQSASTTWRDQLEKAILSAGIKQWPKLWQNLRASCRSDLEERFPEYVVNAWLGHSSRVGRKHYDRIHAGHFDLACGVARGVISSDCGVARGVVAPTPPDTTRQLENKKSRETR